MSIIKNLNPSLKIRILSALREWLGLSETYVGKWQQSCVLKKKGKSVFVINSIGHGRKKMEYELIY